MLAKWDRRWVRLAQEVSTWSKDPSTKVGAVLVRPNNTLCSIGYNGFPKGVPDVGYDDREYKMRNVVHGEMNAFVWSQDASHAGYSLYLWPLAPCNQCTPVIVQHGVARVFYPKFTCDREYHTGVRDLLDTSGIEVVEYGKDTTC